MAIPVLIFLSLLALVGLWFLIPTKKEYDPLAHLDIRMGDITKMGFPIVVNAANRFGLGGGGVDGSIHRAAGPKLKAWVESQFPTYEATNQYGEKELIRIGTGDCITTPGFDLSQYIIHTVGPVYSEEHSGRCEGELRLCYVQALIATQNLGPRRVAFPLISSGVYGYPVEDAIEVAITSILDYLETFEDPGIQVTLVAYDHATYEKMVDEYLLEMAGK